MTGRDRRRDRRCVSGRRPAFAGCAAVILGSGLLASCSSPGDTAIERAGTPPTIPLTSSVSSASETWATLAMGHLDDPLNTFWQLVTLSGVSGSGTHWVLTTPPGVASNGGLVVSLATSGSVLAGFEPSQDLLVSPVARSPDRGATWATGVLPGGLARVPDALASPGGGPGIALLREAGGTVVQSPGGLSTWTSIVTEHLLAREPSTSGCGVAGLTAVAIASVGSVGSASTGGSPIVGTACSHGGRPGIFEHAGGGWEPVGPSLPQASRPIEVVRLLATPTGALALVSVGMGKSVRLYGIWSTDGLRTWTVSSGLPLGGGTLTSTGTTAAGGFVIATSGTGASRSASVVGPSSQGWQSLVPPPAGTSAVVATPEGTFDALVVIGSILDVYSLGAAGWSRTQALSVPIQYGSSG